MSGDRQDACDASPVWIASSASGIWRNPTRGVGAIAVALSVCAFCYACYRAYYAVGGEIGMIGRPVSMGQFRAQLPSSFWLSFDRRTADLQDLLLNEPWFAIEGLLWAAFAIMFVNAPRRAIWLWSAAAGCVMLSAVGVLTGLGVIGSFRIG